MNYCVTIWADWSQVSYRVNSIFGTDFRKWRKMVHMYETIRFRTEYGTEIETTDDTSWPIMIDTFLASNGITLVCVDDNSSY